MKEVFANVIKIMKIIFPDKHTAVSNLFGVEHILSPGKDHLRPAYSTPCYVILFCPHTSICILCLHTKLYVLLCGERYPITNTFIKVPHKLCTGQFTKC